MNIKCASIKVKNIDEAEKFYCGLLGLKEHFRLYNSDGSLNMVYLIDEDGQFVSLSIGEHIPFDSRRSFGHICFLTDDIRALGEKLQASGLDLWMGPSWLGRKVEKPYTAEFVAKAGVKAFYIVDPDGNEIEIMQYTEKSLHLKTKEELKEIDELIRKNEWIPGTKYIGRK